MTTRLENERTEIPAVLNMLKRLLKAKGILYSLIETLGALVGDPDLPEHSRVGYEGLLETARELRAKIGK